MPALQVATLDAIRDPILDILRRSDLSSISAKKVRLALDEQPDPRFPDQKLLQRLQVNLADKEHKKDVDELIRQCFDTVNSGNGAAAAPAAAAPSSSSAAPPSSNGHSNGAGTPRLALPGLGGIPGSHSQASSAAAAEASSAAPRTASTSAAPKRARKSDVISDDEEDIDPAALRAKAKKQAAAKPKKKRKSTAANGGDDDGEKPPPNPNNPFNRPVVLSDAMMNVCGEREMPRYMITKKLWAYIKERDLQNPSNKRQIMCDDTLQNLFGKATVDSFEMAKLISAHVSKKTD